MQRECIRHGLTDFGPKGKKWRCRKCAVEWTDRARKKAKLTLIEEHGGGCQICGYNRSPRALGFHHLDPATKSFTLSDQARTYSLARQREEAAKCALLCANCHMEVEDGIIDMRRQVLVD